jgi:NAD(P)-dependent dehydrogenase (short-subunit alcohol dehydrogenase family)
VSERLKGRTAIVTGAGHGIGRATVELFAEEGARVVLVERDLDAAQEVAGALVAAGHEAIVSHTDVSKSDEVAAAVSMTVERFGTVDVLVNNAGVELKRPVEDITEEEWDRVLSINLKGTFLMSRLVVPIMKAKRSGTIVNNSSVGNFIAAPNSTAYGATKAGMMALTRGMALELAPFNVRVNAVCPGVIDTPMNQRNLMRADDPEAMRRSWYEITPLGRLGTPRDVALSILFLAGDESSFITGTPLIIDGGRMAH